MVDNFDMKIILKPGRQALASLEERRLRCYWYCATLSAAKIKVVVLLALCVLLLLVVTVSVAVSQWAAASSSQTASSTRPVSTNGSLALPRQSQIDSNFNSSDAELHSDAFKTNVVPPWSSCNIPGENVLAVVDAVSISSCELEGSRCSIAIDQDYVLEVAFTTKQSESTYKSPKLVTCRKDLSLRFRCSTIYFLYRTPCNSSNLQCPLRGGKTYLFRNIFGFYRKDQTAPAMNTLTDIEVRLMSHTDVLSYELFCIRIHVNLKGINSL